MVVMADARHVGLLIKTINSEATIIMIGMALKTILIVLCIISETTLSYHLQKYFWIYA